MSLTERVNAPPTTYLEQPVATEPLRDLTLDEAVPLVSALVDCIGRRIGVRTLLIKGATLSWYSLRAERVSADVDVLVEPTGMRALSAALADSGWIERAAVFPGQTDAPHARTLVHPNWPCDIDLHRFFPGMLADPSESFESLWDGRTRASVAHSDCSIPNEVSSALIYRLSLLRGGRGEELESLDRWSQSLRPSERSELFQLIEVTGAGLALKGSSGPWSTSTPPGSISEARRVDQRRRALSGEHGYYYWRVAYGEATPAERMRALFALSIGAQSASWRRALRGVARLLGGITRN